MMRFEDLNWKQVEHHSFPMYGEVPEGYVTFAATCAGDNAIYRFSVKTSRPTFESLPLEAVQMFDFLMKENFKDGRLAELEILKCRYSTVEQCLVGKKRCVSLGLIEFNRQ